MAETPTSLEQAVSSGIYLRDILETVREALLILDGGLRIISANRSFYRLFHAVPEETERKHIFELGSGQWQIAGLRDILDRVITLGEQFQDYEVEHAFPAIGRRIMVLNGRRINQGGGREPLMLLAIEDITERRDALKALEETRRLIDNSPDTVARYGADGRYLYANTAEERLTGLTRDQMIGKTPGELDAPPHIAATIQTAFTRVLETGQTETVNVKYKDRLYQAHFKPETDRSGAVRSFAAYSRDLTDILRLEEELRRSEEIVQSVNSIILITDRSGTMTFINDYGLAYFGFAREELVGRNVVGTIVPETESTGRDLKTLVAAIMADPESYKVNINENVRKNGERVWISWANKAIVDDQNRRGGTLAAGNDITGLKKVEDALRESEEKYRTLVEHANDGIIIVQDGVIRYANRRMADLDGSSTEELVGTKYTDHVHPDELPRITEIYRRRVAGEDVPSTYETVLRRRDGSAAPSELNAAMIRYRGKPADLVIIRDVTERKQREESLRKQEREYRTLAEHSTDVICRFDRGMRHIYVNEQGAKTYGIPRERIIGQTMAELGLAEDKAARWNQNLSQALATGQQITFEFEFSSNLGAQYFLTSFIPEFGDKGLPVSILAVARDITEHKRIENALRRREYEMRTLADNSPDLIFRFNRTMRYVYANPAYERLTGISGGQLISRTNEELGMPLPLVEFWKSAWQRVSATGQEYAAEFEIPGLFGSRSFIVKLIPEFEKSGLVETVLVIARDISERKHAEERIRYISFHDEVTGLFNRAFFEEELRRVDTERELPIGLIMGDVNNLKLTNDVFGHHEGDVLLKAIADSIRRACRQTDITARWGGDEFAVILPRTGRDVTEEICRRITQLAAGTAGTAVQPSIAVGCTAKERMDENIYRTIRQAEEAMYKSKLAHTRENQRAVVERLLARARGHIRDLSAHIEHSYALARIFAKTLKLEEDRTNRLQLLIEMHDIGMAIIPREILTKPGPLSTEEWELVKKHPEVGFRLVKSFPDTAMIADEILSHAERWDGSGYPRGLQGRDIPFLVRAFALIEAYVVLVHDRPYARTLGREEAIAELRRNAGTQFDPDLVEVFIKEVAEKEMAHA